MTFSFCTFDRLQTVFLADFPNSIVWHLPVCCAYHNIVIVMTPTHHVPDVTFVTVTGVGIKVLGLGPLNWVWKLYIIGSVKKSLKMLLTLKIKDQLEHCLKRESIIEKLYIPILERKFSRRWITATFSTLWYFVILSWLPALNAIKSEKYFLCTYCAVLLLTS